MTETHDPFEDIAERLRNHEGVFADTQPTLPPLRPPVKKLSPGLISEPCRESVLSAARRLGVAPEMIWMPMIVSIAVAIGCNIAIKPKKNDPWRELAILWGMNVGDPSALKTPSQNEGLAALSRLCAELTADFMREMKTAEPFIENLRVEQSALKKQLSDAIKSKKGDAEALRASLEKIHFEIKAATPVHRRVQINDATSEKIAEILVENPAGLCLVRDELSGWLLTLSKSGREGEREFYLEAFNGTNSYYVDRIGRGSFVVPALRLCVFGGIQPGKLATMINEASTASTGADGLIERFQLITFPDLPPYRRTDEPENKAAKDRVTDVVKFLYGADFSKMSLKAEKDMPVLNFSAEAQELFYEWHDKLEERLRGTDLKKYPLLQSHLGKYRGLMPKLALIFELIDWADLNCINIPGVNKGLRDVSVDNITRAIATCEFLESHANRIHAIASEPGLSEAHALMAKIESGDIKDESTVRSVHRHHWSGLSDLKHIEAGLSTLVRHNVVRLVLANPEGSGRPSEIIRLHPSLR